MWDRQGRGDASIYLTHPTATRLRPSHGFGRLHPQLRPMAKRRLNPDEIRAAVEAGPPPHSVNYETDKKWHAAQNCWLAKWTERRLPPDSGDSGSSRRDQWRDRKVGHESSCHDHSGCLKIFFAWGGAGSAGCHLPTSGVRRNLRTGAET